MPESDLDCQNLLDWTKQVNSGPIEDMDNVELVGVSIDQLQDCRNLVTCNRIGRNQFLVTHPHEGRVIRNAELRN